MKSFSIAFRIGVSTSVITLIIMYVFALYSIRGAEEIMHESLERVGVDRAKMAARMVRNSLIIHDYKLLNDLPEIVISRNEKLPVLECAVISSKHTYLVHSTTDLTGGQVADEDILSLLARDSGEPGVLKRSETGGKFDELLIVAPVNAGGINWGHVLMVVSMEEINNLISGLQTRSAVLILVLMGVNLCLVLVISRGALRPLARLKQSVDHLVREERIEKLSYDSPDEVGELSRSINEMMDYWRSQYDARVRRQKEADDQRRLSDAVVENINLGLMVTDRDGRIERANSSLEIHMGISPGSITGRKIWDVFPAWESDSIESIFHKVVDSGEIYSNERTLIRSPLMDGEMMFNVSLCPMKTPDSDVMGAVAIFENLTDKVLLEDHLLRVNEELQRANVVKSEFLSMVSHELRTPLTLIKMYSSMLADKKMGELTEKQEKAVEVMNRRCRNLHELIDDLLDLSRIESGKLEMNMEEVYLADLLDDLAGGYESRATASDLEFELEMESRLPPVLADVEKISRVFNNLVENAIKFTDEGKVTLRVLRDGNMPGVALVEVSDTGAGIPEEYAEKVFEKFYQIDGSDTRKHGGSGLGLAIARDIVGIHGGRLWLEKSEPGGGAVFRFTLPFTDPNRTAEAMQKQVYTGASGVRPDDGAPAPLLPGGGSNVLLIDDDVDFLDMMTDVLAEDKYNVFSASDGFEALALLFSEEQIDIILLDVTMPKISGYDLLKMIKSVEAKKSIPVLMLTASGQSDQVQRGYEAGAEGYLVKPFTLEIFKRTMVRIIGGESNAT